MANDSLRPTGILKSINMEAIIFTILIVVPCILLSMTLHEAMHAFAGYWLGDDTAKLEGRLSLNPVKHIDPFLTLGLPLMLILLNGITASSGGGTPIFGAAKPVPFNPHRVKYDEFGAALVGLAGPLTNLLLAVFGAGLYRVIGLGAGELVATILVTFVSVNIGFFIFNMIPFPPLDGSRVLYAFAPEPVQRVMAQIESYGLTGIIIFMFILFPFVSPIMGEVSTWLLRLLLL